MNFKIEGKEIGEGCPTFVIAELSANHLHDKELAKRTIKAIAKTGADAVKIQTYTPDTITIDCDNKYFQIDFGTLWDGKTLYELYQEAHTPWEWQAELKQTAEDCGLIFFSSVFDPSSVDFLEEMNVCAYKIASYEITDIPLIEYTASKGKPIIFSSGVARLEDLKEALQVCQKVGNDQVAFLKCTSTYPAPLSEMNLKAMLTLKKEMGTPVGLSDHSLTTTIAAGAVAMGANIIEKHITLDRSLGGPDAAFSLEPDEFTQMVKGIRDVDEALGSEIFEMINSAKDARRHSRSLFVVKSIAKGDILTRENIRSIRPGDGLLPKYLNDVLGKKAICDMDRGTPLEWKSLEGCQHE